jgi:hypothetical protein
LLCQREELITKTVSYERKAAEVVSVPSDAELHGIRFVENMDVFVGFEERHGYLRAFVVAGNQQNRNSGVGYLQKGRKCPGNYGGGYAASKKKVSAVEHHVHAAFPCWLQSQEIVPKKIFPPSSPFHTGLKWEIETEMAV